MDTSAASWYNHHSGLVTAHNCLSAYGSMLPVLVVEAISNEEVPVQSVSLRLCDSGWACLVSGTCLFVWKFKSGTSPTCPCFELELPPSDLSFRTDLVSLTVKSSVDGPVALLAVSPEGIVRYWPNIGHESSFVESIVQELHGQECSSLCSLNPDSFLLVTTTNSLLLISIQQSELSFRTLKAPQNMLLGLSKKFTSFIFGAMPVSQTSETKSLIRIMKEEDDSGRDFAIVYTIAGATIQKWQIFARDSEVLRAEKDVEHVLKDRFMVSIAPNSDPRRADVVIVDAGLGRENQIILFVALLVPGSRILCAIASFITADDIITLNTFDLISDPSSLLNALNEDSIVNMKLLLCHDRSILYVFDESRIYFVKNNMVLDVIDFEISEDGILGAGVCDNVPLLFTCRDGLVMISSPVATLTGAGESRDDNEVETLPQTMVQEKLRKSLYLFSHSEKEEALSLVTASPESIRMEEWATVIFKHCEDIADCGDVVGDEKLEERIKRRKVPHSFTSQDIFVTRQLEDKVANVNLLIEFVESLPQLKEQMLGSLPLLLILNESLEKLIVALSVKTNRMEFFFLTEPVFLAIAEQRHSTNKNFVHDEFFREASRVHEIISAIVHLIETRMDPSLTSGEETLQLLISAADLLIRIMSEVTAHRSRLPASMLKYAGRLENFTPWDSDINGSRAQLIKFYFLLLNPGCRLASTSDENKQNRECVFDKMASLAEILLCSFSHQLRFMSKASPAQTLQVKNYNDLRSKLLKPLVEAGQYEKATVLAEKYLDFDVLIEISDVTNNPSFLDKYSVMFASTDFSAHLFDWYMRKGQQEKVLKSSHMFSRMLEGHSDLQWLQQIETNNFGAAAQTLKSLAVGESNRSKKKTMLSLCKLAQLATPGLSRISDVDNLLQGLDNQEMSQVGTQV